MSDTLFGHPPFDISVGALGTTHARTLSERFGDILNAKDFGAVGDNVADDTAAIQAALDAAAGKALFLPAGRHRVSGLSVTRDNVHVFGAGMFATELKLIDGSNDHVIDFSGTDGFSLESLSIDGNKANQTGGHCVRGVDVTNFLLDRLHLHDGFTYGIGLQLPTISTRFGLISNCRLIDNGRDGLDIKDAQDIVIANCIAEGNTVDGFNPRGERVTLVGCTAQGNGRHGFNAGTSSGLVTGISMSGCISGGHTTAGAAGFTVSSGGASERAELTLDGCQSRGDDFGAISEVDATLRMSNCIVTGAATRGVHLKGLGGAVNGGEFRDNTGEGIRIETTNVVVSGVHAWKTAGGSQSHGITENGSANNNVITGNRVHGNSTAQIVKLGAGTLVRDNVGYKTEANLISADLAVDSTGTKAFTVAHGLAVTPNIKDCQVTVLRNTAVNDYVWDRLKIDSVDATNVVGRLVISTASGTGGAVANVGIFVRALLP